MKYLKKEKTISTTEVKTIRSWTNDNVEKPDRTKLEALVSKYIKPKRDNNKNNWK